MSRLTDTLLMIATMEMVLLPISWMLGDVPIGPKMLGALIAGILWGMAWKIHLTPRLTKKDRK